MRQVERSIFDLRRGLPVLVRGDDGAATLVAPLEGIDDAALRRLTEHAGSTASLVLTRHRLALLDIETDAEARRLPVRADDPATSVLEWACARRPSSRPSADPAPVDAGDAAALALMRRGLLIPAAITAPVAASHRSHVEASVTEGSLLAVTREAILTYERQAPCFLKRVSGAEVPLAESEQSRFVLFREADGMREHVAIVIGDSQQWGDAIPVRLHSACLTGDLFGSLRCDCGEQLRSSVARIAENGGGVLLYLAQEGRGIGLANKLRAYSLQDDGLDTVDADHVLGFGDDERDYNVAVEMLSQLGIRRIELLTNNPAKIEAMSRGGVTVVQRSGIYGRLTRQNKRYLNAKANRAGHWLDDVLGAAPGDATPNR